MIDSMIFKCSQVSMILKCFCVMGFGLTLNHFKICMHSLLSGSWGLVSECLCPLKSPSDSIRRQGLWEVMSS